MVVSDESGASKRWVIDLSGKYVSLVKSDLDPLKPARILFDYTRVYRIEVLMKVTSTGLWVDSLPTHKQICSELDTFLPHSGYVVCPQIVDYEEEFNVVRFQSGSLESPAVTVTV